MSSSKISSMSPSAANQDKFDACLDAVSELAVSEKRGGAAAAAAGMSSDSDAPGRVEPGAIGDFDHEAAAVAAAQTIVAAINAAAANDAGKNTNPVPQVPGPAPSFYAAPNSVPEAARAPQQHEVSLSDAIGRNHQGVHVPVVEPGVPRYGEVNADSEPLVVAKLCRLAKSETLFSEEDNDDDDGEEEEDDDDDARFLEVCIDGDVEDLVHLLEEMANQGEALTPKLLNYPDSSGRSPVSYLCGNGMIEMLDLLEEIPHLDFNAPDSEGNTPLHFAAQAGHVDVVSFLLNKVRTINVDPVNKLGFTPLMKSALQGRVKCSRLLLFSGASPQRRDLGRGLTASQWARYCQRGNCAEAIDKFVSTAVTGMPGGNGSGAKQNGEKRAKEKGFRARGSSSERSSSRSSWIARKLKKAFGSGPQHSSHTDLSFLSSAAAAGGGGTKKQASGKFKVKAAKVTVPKVEITPDPEGERRRQSCSDDDSDDDHAHDDSDGHREKGKKR